MTTRPDPVRDADAEALAMARALLSGAEHAALAVTDPNTWFYLDTSSGQLRRSASRIMALAARPLSAMPRPGPM